MAETFSFTAAYRGRVRTPGEAIDAANKDLDMISRGVPKVVRKELRKALELAIASVKQRRPLKGSVPYDSLEVVDTGGAVKDITLAIRGARFLAAHEFGATIRATRANWLTIPLPAALTGDGRKIHKSAREWRNTFVLESKRGNLLICKKQGRRLIPLYVLRKEVTIKPRLGLRAAINEQVGPMLSRIMDAMDKELARG